MEVRQEELYYKTIPTNPRVKRTLIILSKLVILHRSIYRTPIIEPEIPIIK